MSMAGLDLYNNLHCSFKYLLLVLSVFSMSCLLESSLLCFCSVSGPFWKPLDQFRGPCVFLFYRLEPCNLRHRVYSAAVIKTEDPHIAGAKNPT